MYVSSILTAHSNFFIKYVMDVVTVSHNKDKELLEWQLYSIHQYLEPCNIHIVINEDNIDEVKNHIDFIVRRMRQHNVKIWSRQEILPYKINKQGWWHQQLIKLFMPLKKDYVVLDCKDIFIKKTSLNDLIKTNAFNQPNLIGCPTWGQFFEPVNEFVGKHFKNKISAREIKGIQTPRLIKKTVVDKIESFFKTREEFVEWFMSFKLPSEFILYDTVSLYMNIKDNERYHEDFLGSTWNQEMWESEKFSTVKDNTQIFKIHRRVYNNEKNKHEIICWLENKINKNLVISNIDQAQIVTVSHWDERDLFILQLKSIDAFLEDRIVLNVVINEDDHLPMLHYIQDTLDSITNHDVVVWSRKDIIGNVTHISHPNLGDGWGTQQLCKLLIPLRTDWISLDGKDLFIRPIRLHELKGLWFKAYEDLSLKDPMGPFYKATKKYLKKKGLRASVDPKLINHNVTPRYIHKQVIDKILLLFDGKDKFMEWFLSHQIQSEYILHDYVTANSKELPLQELNTWYWQFSTACWTVDQFETSHRFENINPYAKIYKLHRRVFLHKDNQQKIEKWMNTIIDNYKKYKYSINSG